jgi:ubiquinone/menaquinone biosynthesis C-methylase UbiE
MATQNENERERAYRFDLFIAPDWCERFDSIVAEHVELPTKGRLLEINSGTGSRVIAIAGTIEEGEVIGAEPNAERVAIARAKATAADEDRCSFVEADPERLAFEDASFDAVVVDTTLSEPSRLAPLAAEALRVARAGAPVAVKVLLRGSFDEFFSIYWEALHDVGLAEQVWGDLERIVVEHPTFAEAVSSVESVGLRDAESHRSKEEWRFETGAEFLESPLVSDLFLDEWFSLVPEDRLAEVREAVRQVIDRESEGAYFDVSAKALVISGVK